MAATEQPAIFMEPTIVVDQCSWCGTLVAWHPDPERLKLSSCPACGSETWWRQNYSDVGPFRGLE